MNVCPGMNLHPFQGEPRLAPEVGRDWLWVPRGIENDGLTDVRSYRK